MRCVDCGHVHGGGYCAEVCAVCIAQDKLEQLEAQGDFDADELGLDPEEEFDA